jgi:hypothetical protein
MHQQPLSQRTKKPLGVMSFAARAKKLGQCVLKPDACPASPTATSAHLPQRARRYYQGPTKPLTASMSSNMPVVSPVEVGVAQRRPGPLHCELTRRGGGGQAGGGGNAPRTRIGLGIY